MERTLNTAERNVQTLPPNVITLAAGVAAILIPDSRRVAGEIAYRRIQNVGNNDLYVSYGLVDGGGNAVCDAVANFHKLLVSGQEIDLSNDRQVVCGYSAAGTIVAVEVRQRL